MALSNLIEQVNNPNSGVANTAQAKSATKKEAATSLPSRDLDKLVFKELLELSDTTCSWLETHACEPGTGNTVDINGRPYDQEGYEKILKLYEKITVEIFRRPPEEGFI